MISYYYNMHFLISFSLSLSLFFSYFSLLQLGKLADAIGRRPVMMLGTVVLIGAMSQL